MYLAHTEMVKVEAIATMHIILDTQKARIHGLQVMVPQGLMDTLMETDGQDMDIMEQVIQADMQTLAVQEVVSTSQCRVHTEMDTTQQTIVHLKMQHTVAQTHPHATTTGVRPLMTEVVNIQVVIQ